MSEDIKQTGSGISDGCTQFVGMPKHALQEIARHNQNYLAHLGKETAEKHPNSLEARLIAQGIQDPELAEVVRLGTIFSTLGMLKPRERQ